MFKIPLCSTPSAKVPAAVILAYLNGIVASFMLSPTWNRVVLVPPWVSSIPYNELYSPPSKLIWLAYSVEVFTKSGMPSPAPAFSAISWNFLLLKVEIGSVNNVIVSPFETKTIWGSFPDGALAAVPASNWTIASKVDGIPPSINANSSTSNVTRSSLVLGFQSYTFATLLFAFSTLRITLSPTLNLYVDTPLWSFWEVSRITLWS